MARFLLVHGAFHGSWCWERIVPILEEMGHRADSVDLPGLGKVEAHSPADWLDAWSGAVIARLRADPEPAILVGHSRAGIIISDAADKAPGNVRGLVFLAALVTRNGQSASELREAAGSIAQSPIRLVPSKDGLSAHVDKESLLAAAYGGADPADLDAIRARLSAEPLAGFAIAPRLGETGFGQVPKIYLECLRDLAIPIAFQREMQRLLPCPDVMTLDTDHAPYWSQPVLLCRALDRCARQFQPKTMDSNINTTG